MLLYVSLERTWQENWSSWVNCVAIDVWVTGYILRDSSTIMIHGGSLEVIAIEDKNVGQLVTPI